MEYGINIDYFTSILSMQEAAELIAKAGFTNLDYTPPVTKENWASDMKEALRIFDHYGLKVHQTHAPFNRYGGYNGIHKLCLDRCAEATAVMGAKYMVAHGDEFDFDNMTFSAKAALELNHDLYLPYVEFGKKNGFKVAFETLFEDIGKRRYTSDADELMALITSFEKGDVACCWDSGHANVSFGRKTPEIIKRFGALIECTHIHDNTGTDSHQMPMTGDIDWKSVIDAFREIGYQGVTSVEYAHGKIPQKLMENFISLTYKAAEHLWLL